MTFINAMNIYFFQEVPLQREEGGAGRPNIIFNAAFPSLPPGTLQHFAEGVRWERGRGRLTLHKIRTFALAAAAAANFGNLS